MSLRDWIVSKLKKSDESQEVATVTPLNDSLIEVTSKKGKIIIVGVIERELISSIDVHKICKDESKQPNVLVAKFESIWDGSAIDYARQHNMAWGGMGNITSAFDTNNYSGIQRNEYKFVENNLGKHSRVEKLERLYDRVFKIYRTNGFRPITITLIDSYELTGEEVRNARDKYGKFDIVLKTNPNGNSTGRAFSAADEIGAEICTWSELFGRLNKR